MEITADQLNRIEQKIDELLENLNKKRPKSPTVRTKLKVEKLPDDWKQYCHDKRPDLDPERVFEDFRDYWLASGKVMKDWGLTWKRWVRNSRKQPRLETSNGLPSVPDYQLGDYARMKGLPEARPGESCGEYRQRLMRIQ